VISTVAAPDAAHALDRLVTMYPTTDQEGARVRLVESLCAVIAQRLVPRAAGEGLAAVVEVVRGTPEARALLRQPGRADELLTLVADGQTEHGSQTFDQHLVDLIEAGVVSRDVARTVARDPQQFGAGA
jgi:twitching motility protein PilT